MINSNQAKSPPGEGTTGLGEPCPNCGAPALAITYGLPTPQAIDDPTFYSGGCLMDVNNPNWACRECELEF